MFPSTYGINKRRYSPFGFPAAVSLSCFQLNDALAKDEKVSIDFFKDLKYRTINKWNESSTEIERALPESQEQPQQHPVDPGLTDDGKQICAPTTPCAWVVYKPFIREIEYSFTNNYCECGPGTTCQYYDDDISISAYVHRCRKDTDNHRLPADPK
ncbi:hypothetical protein EVAR_40115_1 [Eumeta japonica]|uniref:Uncharacterized protein n=1 Tax=Eumeta variegata TaxID=151549 RepID=A0A4C1WAL7_EUMVA|nr:hypothetical protein EVAR_40115_1 [Eumeta japonica]